MARNPSRRDLIGRQQKTEEQLRLARLRGGDIGGPAILTDDGAMYSEPEAESFTLDLAGGGHDVSTNGGGWTVDTDGGQIHLKTGVGNGEIRLNADGSISINDADVVIEKNLTLSNYEGINEAVGSGATSINVGFGVNQADAFYEVFVSPHWNTTWWITSRATTGFTINFGTAPGAASAVGWILVR